MNKNMSGLSQMCQIIKFDDELYTILKCNDFNCAKFDEKGNNVRKCDAI